MAVKDLSEASSYEEYWYGPDVATFGDRLAAARDFSGMTVAEFAKRLGVKKSTIGSWEDDLSEPRANRLQMMAGLLSVSVGWLLTGVGEGVDAPVDDVDMNAHRSDIAGLLVEVRDIRAHMRLVTDHLGRLEKQLRLKMKDDIYD